MEIDIAVLERLLNTDQNGVFLDALGCTCRHYVAQLGESAERMLCIVVVPWNIVVVEKGEVVPDFCTVR